MYLSAAEFQYEDEAKQIFVSSHAYEGNNSISATLLVSLDEARKLARDIDQILESIDRADEIEATDASTHSVDFATCDACGDDSTREQHEAARLGQVPA